MATIQPVVKLQVPPKCDYEDLRLRTPRISLMGTHTCEVVFCLPYFKLVKKNSPETGG